MRQIGWLRVLMAVGLVLGVTSVGRAELADVYLKNGLRLRGDVTQTAEELILRNAAGELRVALDDVERVVEVEGEEAAREADATTMPGPVVLPGETEEAAAKEGSQVLEPAPPISKSDINRLRLGELTVDGAAEQVRVRFHRGSRDDALTSVVLRELKERADYQQYWAEILRRGRAADKLQLIVRETGLEHVDRIEILSDPAAFRLYRRDVLPLINRSCGRSGCHAGTRAQAFRLPVGASTSTEYAYTSFVLLDQMMTRQGALIKREYPAASVLVSYMLPQENNPRAHPDVGGGPRFRAVLRSKDDPEYRAVVDWINYLFTPRPAYGLEYESPYPGPLGAVETGGTSAADEASDGDSE